MACCFDLLRGPRACDRWSGQPGRAVVLVRLGARCSFSHGAGEHCEVSCSCSVACGSTLIRIDLCLTYFIAMRAHEQRNVTVLGSNAMRGATTEHACRSLAEAQRGWQDGKRDATQNLPNNQETRRCGRFNGGDCAMYLSWSPSKSTAASSSQSKWCPKSNQSRWWPKSNQSRW